MKGFLNSFMGRHKHLAHISKKQMTAVFKPTIEIVHQAIGDRAFRLAKVLNAAVFDGVMVGVARRLERGPITDLAALANQYTALITNPEFLAVAEKATADEESVFTRLRLATAAFEKVA
jgi:hypothetical protein